MGNLQPQALEIGADVLQLVQSFQAIGNSESREALMHVARSMAAATPRPKAGPTDPIQSLLDQHERLMVLLAGPETCPIKVGIWHAIADQIASELAASGILVFRGHGNA